MTGTDHDLRILGAALVQLLQQDDVRAAIARLTAAGVAHVPEPARPAEDLASPQAIATGLLMEGCTLTEIARRLGVCRQTLYKGKRWAVFQSLHKGLLEARWVKRNDLRRRQNGDSREICDDD